MKQVKDEPTRSEIDTLMKATPEMREILPIPAKLPLVESTLRALEHLECSPNSLIVTFGSAK